MVYLKYSDEQVLSSVQSTLEMKDFTLRAYKRYLQAIKASFSGVLTFEEFFRMEPKPDSYCMLRHDVDRRPKNALEMAKIENAMGMHATYYFRAKSACFHLDMMREIEGLGHEIGYHYECLSDNKGDMHLALKSFENNLEKFRTVVSIRTISMHGAPLSPLDNRDMWRDPKNHDLLLGKFGILGEVYLDIDYRDTVYINDTGRNWFSSKSNLRDRVISNLNLDFKNGEALYRYLVSNPNPRVVFQVHPERWTDKVTGYYLSFLLDTMINACKYGIRWVGEKR